MAGHNNNSQNTTTGGVANVAGSVQVNAWLKQAPNRNEQRTTRAAPRRNAPAQALAVRR